MITLPIDALIPKILTAIRGHKNTILTATPGAGKTTRLPPELLNVVTGKILVLEPRRMAAVAACSRVCEERSWQIGGHAGYQVRFDSKMGRDTRLAFMTDALLLRRMVDDPELEGVDLVVVDEFHERNLNQDLILGAVRELQDMGREIKLLVMSATLETARLKRYLGPDAAVVDVPGAVFPLEIRYAQQPLRLQTDQGFYERVTEAVAAAERQGVDDILVFLPGTGEITRLGEQLKSRTKRNIVPLHGSLPLSEQQRVLLPPQSPRVILATNVAEASVTVQGVDCVIDTGLAKSMEMNTRTGFSSLELKRISLFNARQRAGRAARQKAGVCYRLWTEHEEITQAIEPVPECQRADLAGALLWLAHFGVRDFHAFAWFDAPSGPLVGWALRALRALGALDDENRLTVPLGEKLIHYPLPPRQGALLARGEELGIGTTAARLAAILGERDFAEGVDTHAQTECDMLLRLDLLREMRTRAAQSVLEASRQLERLVQPGEGDTDDVRHLLLMTQLDRLCRRRGRSERALMIGGRGVRLSPRSQVRTSEFFVALQGVDLPNQPDTTISLASGFDKDFIMRHLREQIVTTEDLYFDQEKMQFFARRLRRIGDLPIEEPTLTQADPNAIGEGMVDALLERWDWLATQHEGLKAWLQRWTFLAKHDSQLSEISVEHRRQVLQMAAFGRTRVSEVLAADLVGFLEAAIGKEAVRKLDDNVPAQFCAPSGVSHPIHYEELHGAYVDVRLQEVFGLLSTPRIVRGRVPLTFRLLGPNYRPVQVTADLESFWRTSYHEVRKELRLRYPKHSWPEDPYTARAEAKGRRRPPST